MRPTPDQMPGWALAVYLNVILVMICFYGVLILRGFDRVVIAIEANHCECVK